MRSVGCRMCIEEKGSIEEGQISQDEARPYRNLWLCREHLERVNPGNLPPDDGKGVASG